MKAVSLDGFHMPKSIIQVMHRLQTYTFVELQSTTQQQTSSSNNDADNNQKWLQLQLH